MRWSAFQKLLAQPVLDLPTAALHYARNIAYPDLNIAKTLAQIDLLAADARHIISSQTSLRDQAETVSTYLFAQCGFRGNAINYNDPRNSYLNDVLERRLGIPITLSVLYLVVAQKLNIPAYGIGLPGHFIVGVTTAAGPLLLDPFHNGVWLSPSDCLQLVRQTTGYQGAWQSHWLDKTNERLILLRMLNNLRLVYAGQEKWELVLLTLQHLQLVAPHTADFIRDEGLVHYQLGNYTQAAALLEQYLRQNPQAADAPLIKQRIGPALDKWASLN